MRLLSLCFWVAAVLVIQAAPLPHDSAVGVVWTFPNGTWIENLAVRQNGEVLCTSLTDAALYLVNPFRHTTKLVHQFDSEEDLLGITEIEEDVFAIVSANISFETSTASPGSAKLWRADVGAWEESNPITLVNSLSKVGLPDGIVALPNSPGMVLLADAANGIIWNVDAWTGEHAIFLQDDLFLPHSTALPLGIDGIRIWNGWLFFTNLAQSIFGRVRITMNGSNTSKIQVLVNTTFGDDFALDADGTAYVVGDNTLYRVSLNGSVTIITGGPNDLTLEGATSAQFGRTSVDNEILYIGTNGGLLTPIDGQVHGGQLLAINTKIFRC